VATEPGCAFGGDALLEVVAVNELSIPMTTHSLSAPSYSFAKDVTVGATVNNRAHYYSEQASCVAVWLSFRGGDDAEN